MPPVFVVLWSSAFIAGTIGTDAAPLLLTFVRFAIAGTGRSSASGSPAASGSASRAWS
jgi:hypothetical protein